MKSIFKIRFLLFAQMIIITLISFTNKIDAEMGTLNIPPILEEIQGIPYSELETIEGYFTVTIYDMKALSILINRINAKNCLEVGTFLGTGSTTLFYGAGVNLVCVDHWLGNENDPFMQNVRPHYDFFEICKSNVNKYDIENRITLVNSDSVEASTLVPDQSLDLIFIDGDHTYKGCKRDVEAWLPKVRSGGIICGHDCEGRIKDFPRFDFSDQALEGVDYSSRVHAHVGVIRAIHEIFGDKAHLFMEEPFEIENYASGRSTIWYYQIP